MKATITAKNGVNVRVKPSTGARVLGVVKLDEELTVSLVSDGWCTVEKCDDFPEGGYFMARLADVVDGVAEPKPITADDADEPEAEDGNGEDGTAEAATAANTDDTGDDGEAAELEQMTVAQLRQLAKDSGIEVPSSAKKAELIEAIINAD